MGPEGRVPSNFGEVYLVQGCSHKKEMGGRLKQDLDKDLQLRKLLILLY